MTDTKSDADKTGEEPGQNTAGKDKGKDTDTSKDQDAKVFTQADLDRVAAKTREEEKEKARKAKEQEDRKRDEAKATEQGEFQKLADSRQKELDELKPKYEALETELKDLKPAFAALIAAELKALPAEVVESGPAKFDDAKALSNPSEVAAWLPKGKALAAKLDSQPAKPGAGADPKAKSAPGDADRDKAAQGVMAANYRTF